MIETERLRLRPFRPDDAEHLYAMHAEPHVMRFYGTTTREDVEKWLEADRATRAAGGLARLVIEDRATGEFLGRSGLKLWEQFGEVEVAWMLRANALGKGHATESGKACLDWGFANLDVPYVTAMILPENTPSRSIAERLGMTTIREDVLNDKPVLVYALHRA